MSASVWATRRPLLVGHRGGALEAPENTLHAFNHAVAHGARMLELDVRATADGEPVVVHDGLLDRTTDGTGPVAEHALHDILVLDAAHWFVPGRGAKRDGGPYPLRGVATGAAPPPAGLAPEELRIPTLRAVLDAFPDAWITMELKVDGLHAPVVDLLRARGREADVIIGGFDADRIESVRAAAPDIATSATEPEVAAFWAWAHSLGEPPARLPYAALQVPSTHRGVDVVTAAFVARAHGCGIAVHVWTVDEPEEMHRLLDLGVDGLMTDRPTALARVIAERAAA